MVMRDDRTSVNSVVRDELRERFARAAKHEVMKFDDRKGRDNCAIGADTQCHFAFNRKIGVSRMGERGPRMMEFILEEACMNRAAHAELLDHAGSNASNLVASDSISFCATQGRHLGLNIIGFPERDRRFRLAKKGPGLNALIVTPLALGQSP